MRLAIALSLLVACGDDRSSTGRDLADASLTDARASLDGATEHDAGRRDAAGTDAGGAPDASDRDAGEGVPDAGAPCTDTLGGSGPVAGPQGLMIQTHTTNDLCLLERSLDHLCRAHRSGTGVVHDLVLTDAVTAAGGRPTETLNEAVLDRVLAARACWDNLFVGTIPEVILTDPYAPSTINDETSRWTWIDAARRVADAVRAYMAREAPDLAWHWYVSYEANLNYFTDATYRASYVALLDQHVRDLGARHPTTAILWSPTFWTDPSGLSSSQRASLSSALGDLFARVPGITWVVVQDHVGVSAAFSCADALDYYGMVRAAAPSLASVQINVEYFDATSGAIRAGDPAELAARVRCYLDAGASLGASFEHRYWYDTHGH